MYFPRLNSFSILLLAMSNFAQKLAAQEHHIIQSNWSNGKGTSNDLGKDIVRLMGYEQNIKVVMDDELTQVPEDGIFYITLIQRHSGGMGHFVVFFTSHNTSLCFEPTGMSLKEMRSKFNIPQTAQLVSDDQLVIKVVTARFGTRFSHQACNTDDCFYWCLLFCQSCVNAHQIGNNIDGSSFNNNYINAVLNIWKNFISITTPLGFDFNSNTKSDRNDALTADEQILQYRASVLTDCLNKSSAAGGSNSTSKSSINYGAKHRFHARYAPY
jgi:hypothetical protein